MDCTVLIEQTDNLKANKGKGAYNELLQQACSMRDRLLLWYALIQKRAGQPMLYKDEVDPSSSVNANLPVQVGDSLRFESLAAAQAHIMYWATMLLLCQIMEDVQELVDRDSMRTYSSPSPDSVGESNFFPTSPQSFMTCNWASTMQCLTTQQQQQELELDLGGLEDNLFLGPSSIPIPSLPTTAARESYSSSLSSSLSSPYHSYTPCNSTYQTQTPPLSTTTVPGPLITTPDLPYSYASLICRSVLYCTDPSMKALGSQLILFPLWLAKEYFVRSHNPEMCEWCCNMLRAMGNSGICCAPTMGDEGLDGVNNNGNGHSVPVC